MAANPASIAPSRPPFWFKLSIRMGNLVQVDGLILGSVLLIMAAHSQSPAVIRIVLMILGWFVIYICCHAIAHWVVGLLGRIRFEGYGVRGTDHPENYPPGLRQMMSVLPTFTVMSEKTSMKKPGREPERSCSRQVRLQPQSVRFWLGFMPGAERLLVVWSFSSPCWFSICYQPS
jgi:hypothetical protein